MIDLLSITSFTPESILRDDFADTLPDYYKLKGSIESQGWHNNQTVFDHSIKSATELEAIVAFEFLQEYEREQVLTYLNSKVGTHTRLELLRLATLLHDIGKLISLQYNAQGNTGSPSHGILGAWVAKPIVDTFDMGGSEKKFVLGLIADHLVPSDLIEMSINNDTPHQEVVTLLLENRPNTTIELLLLSYADWLGCTIRESVHEEREARIGIVHECLTLANRKLSGRG